MTDVVIGADAWDGNGQGFISNWFFEDGEAVCAGAVIADLMYEKVAVELVAPVAGRLKILVAAEQPISKGQVVARLL
ncbi:MAG TPA: biotin/lipoyl-containing protein [Steroidobacter sp.]|uniref:biotin/lipoyl-containing protein n=1 Tax=Steroidobacter sp. TaxID=1978227 RepID=UPI002ED7BCA3